MSDECEVTFSAGNEPEIQFSCFTLLSNCGIVTKRTCCSRNFWDNVCAIFTVCMFIAVTIGFPTSLALYIKGQGSVIPLIIFSILGGAPLTIFIVWFIKKNNLTLNQSEIVKINNERRFTD